MQIVRRARPADDLSKAYRRFAMAQGVLVDDRHEGARGLRQPRLCGHDRREPRRRTSSTVESLLSDVPEAAATIVIRLASGAARRPGRRRRVPPVPGDPAGLGARRATGTALVGARHSPIPGRRQPRAERVATRGHLARAGRAGTLLPRPAEGDRPSGPGAGGLLLPPRATAASPIINATLADWLGIDLASFYARRSISLRRDRGRRRHGAGERSVKADAGSTRNAVIDLDLATVTGEALAGALHAPRQRQAGTELPGHRAHDRAEPHVSGEDSRRRTCARAEVRFTRFFNSTPMAIAGVDANRGASSRTNAPFLSLFSSVVDRDALDRKHAAGHGHPRARPGLPSLRRLKPPNSVKPTLRQLTRCCPIATSAISASM
jgi:two-component system cell cycle sensor histidine kinase/response regulator CckA